MYWKQHKIITSSISRLILGHIEIYSGRAKHKDFVRQEQKNQVRVITDWGFTGNGKEVGDFQHGTRTYLAQNFKILRNTSYDYACHGTDGSAVEYSK